MKQQSVLPRQQGLMTPPPPTAMATPSTSSTTTTATATSMFPSALQKKAEEINLLLLQPDVDLWKLRELALSEGGLVNDTLRKTAWPKLVGLDYKLDPVKLPSSENNKENDDLNNVADDNDQNKSQKSKPSPSHPPGVPQFELAAAELHQGERDGSSSNNAVDPTKTSIGPNESQSNNSTKRVVTSLDSLQIDRDVARCSWHLLSGSQRSRRWQYQHKQGSSHKSKKIGTLLKKKQRRLANLINVTLVTSYNWPSPPISSSQQQQLRYYQGYHDVACIFLHALGGHKSGGGGGRSASIPNEALATTSSTSGSSSSGRGPTNILSTGNIGDLELPSRVLCQVSFSHFSDALQSNFLQLQTGLKLVFFPLLAKLDMEVHNHLLDADMEPFFCLSWIITWFSHDVRDTELVKRLFDAFLVSHPLFPVYMSLAMMLHPHNRSIIMQTDCDFASLHQCLASLPRHSCQVGWKKREDGWEGAYISDDEPDDPHDDEDAWQVISPPPHHAASTKGASQGTPTKLKDDRTVSTDGIDESLDHISASNHGSVVASTSTPQGRKSTTLDDDDGTDRNPVPFQQLIDSALGYIKKYPPNGLVRLAQSYFKDDWTNQLMLLSDKDFNYPSPSELQSQIGLLRPCPLWATVPSCTSDWVIKQRLRQLLGLKPTSRNDRRRRQRRSGASPQKPKPRRLLNGPDESASITGYSGTPDALALSVTTLDSCASNEETTKFRVSSSKTSKADTQEYLKAHSNSLAVIAVGYGPGYWRSSIMRSRRKRRRTAVAVGTATVIMVGAIAMGISMNYQDHNGQKVPSPELIMDGVTETYRKNASVNSKNHRMPDSRGTPPTLVSVPSSIDSLDNIILPKIDVLHQTGGKVQVGTPSASMAGFFKGGAARESSTSLPTITSRTQKSKDLSSNTKSSKSGRMERFVDTPRHSSDAGNEPVEVILKQPFRIIRRNIFHVFDWMKKMERITFHLIQMISRRLIALWKILVWEDYNRITQNDL